VLHNRQFLWPDTFGSWRDLGCVAECSVRINAIESLDVYGIYCNPSSAFRAVTWRGNSERNAIP
jgi:hypothetical protein